MAKEYLVVGKAHRKKITMKTMPRNLAAGQKRLEMPLLMPKRKKRLRKRKLRRRKRRPICPKTADRRLKWDSELKSRRKRRSNK